MDELYWKNKKINIWSGLKTGKDLRIETWI